MKRKIKTNKKPTNKKNNTKVNRKKRNSEIGSGQEIMGLFLIVIGIVFFICLYSQRMGIVGSLIYKLFSVLSGSANFLIPLLLIFWGILFNIQATKIHMSRYISFSLVILLCILVFLDGSKEMDMTLIERIIKSTEYMDITRSGGIIGAIFGFFSYKLLGSLGTYIILSLVIIASIYFMIRPNIEHIIMTFEDLGEYFEDKKLAREEKRYEKKLKLEEKEKKKELKESKKKEIKKVEEKELDNSEDLSESLVIKNYSEDSIPENKDFEDVAHTDDIEFTNDATIETQDDEEEVIDTIKDDIENKKEEEFIYTYPDTALLDRIPSKGNFSKDEVLEKGKIIENTMKNFGIDSKVVAINRGPVITSYELKPAPGIKLSRIVGLSDNIAMALASSDLRIEAPIPGKTVVGIEVPNKDKDSVALKELIESQEFKNSKSDIPLTLGKDVEGNILISGMEDMPHLLIAGATGSGKSVCINSIITSVIYKSSPKDVKLMLIDPKVVELSVYNGIPHLLIDVVTNPKKAAFALNWAVDEMEKRYEAFAENHVRDLKGYNKKMMAEGKEDEKLPKILIIVDELADLMMVASKEIEEYIARLAQKARAAGMHLILATQRPSVDVITGTIKANVPSRIAFAVASSVDSRTILDMGGAEKLLGKGDMLFYPSKYPKPKRIQGAFISDEEVERLVDFVKSNNEIKNKVESKIEQAIEDKKVKIDNEKDPLFKEAVELVVNDEQASISYIQRKLKVGYSRAGRIVDQMEEMGIIGPHEGSKPRKLLKTKEELDMILGEEDE
ncbi:DNA translocase FtsK 4TM domain-containing protein [Peptoniphilus harei]|uniref:FtsK/SpoIIIE family DNA translocase n=1 Tax=Peptoniphilus TaxID=162289 RepID=UPI00254A054F|nr:DNA translocase FtsK [Peptoniphilus harei]MDK7354661.1 DNA translocase FtsK 4TM domain-containing protein [Peptoniphilus harei]MDK7370464.1 DNA translocase FtsK 4TM domain-containing protein [Peptoniphilus harei]